ncbi:MAG: TolC family protein [Candidatus Eisenbacteria bacterium]
MNRRITCVVLALAAALTIAPAYRGVSARELGIGTAVDTALERNLSLEAARQDYESAKWGLRSARSSLFPSVRLSSTWGPMAAALGWGPCVRHGAHAVRCSIALLDRRRHPREVRQARC